MAASRHGALPPPLRGREKGGRGILEVRRPVNPILILFAKIASLAAADGARFARECGEITRAFSE
jgi:hypothetical protein